MQKLAITGAKGTIGTILCEGLTNVEIIPTDLPETDVLDYESLLSLVSVCDTVVHLAWDNSGSEELLQRSEQMFENVLRACVEAKVGRVILASSIHAQNFYVWSGDRGLRVEDELPPSSTYGEMKLKMEARGKWYAENYPIEVIAIRFGGVTLDDRILDEKYYEKIQLRRNDAASLVQKCIDADISPGNHIVLYGISENEDMIHDVSNGL